MHIFTKILLSTLFIALIPTCILSTTNVEVTKTISANDYQYPDLIDINDHYSSDQKNKGTIYKYFVTNTANIKDPYALYVITSYNGGFKVFYNDQDITNVIPDNVTSKDPKSVYFLNFPDFDSNNKETGFFIIYKDSDQYKTIVFKNGEEYTKNPISLSALNDFDDILKINNFYASGHFISIQGHISGKNTNKIFSFDNEGGTFILQEYSLDLNDISNPSFFYIINMQYAGSLDEQYAFILQANTKENSNLKILYCGVISAPTKIISIYHVDDTSTSINVESNFIHRNNTSIFDFIAKIDGVEAEYSLDCLNKDHIYQTSKNYGIDFDTSKYDNEGFLLNNQLDLFCQDDQTNSIYKSFKPSNKIYANPLDLHVATFFNNPSGISSLVLGVDGLVHTSYSWGSDQDNVFDIYPPTKARSNLPLIILGACFGSLLLIVAIVGSIYLLYNKKSKNSLASTSE